MRYKKLNGINLVIYYPIFIELIDRNHHNQDRKRTSLFAFHLQNGIMKFYCFFLIFNNQIVFDNKNGCHRDGNLK